MTPYPLDLWLQTFPSRQGAQALEGPRSPHQGWVGGAPCIAWLPTHPSTGLPAQPGGWQQSVEQSHGGLDSGSHKCHRTGRAFGDHLLPPVPAPCESPTLAWQFLRGTWAGGHPQAYRQTRRGLCTLLPSHIHLGEAIRTRHTLVPMDTCPAYARMSSQHAPLTCSQRGPVDLGNPHARTQLCTSAYMYVPLKEPPDIRPSHPHQSTPHTLTWDTSNASNVVPM